MLQRANDEIEACSIRHQEETEEWRSSCDRLTSSAGRKDNDITMLAEQLEQAQDEVRWRGKPGIQIWYKQARWVIFLDMIHKSIRFFLYVIVQTTLNLLQTVWKWLVPSTKVQND